MYDANIESTHTEKLKINYFFELTVFELTT